MRTTQGKLIKSWLHSHCWCNSFYETLVTHMISRVQYGRSKPIDQWLVDRVPKNCGTNMRSAHTWKMKKEWPFTTKQFLILSHIMAVQILCCARAGDGKYLACFRRATKPTKHATQLPAFGSKPMKKFVSYQWKPCKVKMFSYSATKKWIKTYNLRSLREKKRYKKRQKNTFHEKLLKKDLLNLIELSIIIT